MFRLDARPTQLLLATTLVLAVARAAPAQVNLTPGDIAIIGWVDNGSPNDIFSIVALADLPPGTNVYFTDNGWDSVAGVFRNTNGPTDGNGDETLTKLSINALIPAGTILSTTDVLSPAFTWTTTGAIPGAATGSFGPVVLSQSGDQIYAFQHDTGSNPLNTPTQMHLFAIDDTGTFEDATSSATGNVPSGLSVAGNTAVTFAQSASGQSFMAFSTNVLPGGSKANWLAAIHDPANWTFGSSGTLPAGTILVGNAGIGYFCYGDGTLATPCPCGNGGTPGHGCNNSAATGGAQLTAAGAPSPDSILLTSTGELQTVLTIFLQGDINLSAGVVFGDGVRCAGGTLKKIGVKSASGGVASYPQSGDPSITAKSAMLGDTIPAGALRYYQAYYRDPDMTFCPDPPGNTWNVSNAVQILW